MNLATAGYVFNFQCGAYAPEGRIEDQPSQEEIDSHNRQLAQHEIEAMKQTGRGVLYLFYTKQPAANHSTPSHVGTWASSAEERFAIFPYRKSRNNFGAKRIDLWFRFDGSLWHGVNIGDNDIVRCRRTKGR